MDGPRNFDELALIEALSSLGYRRISMITNEVGLRNETWRSTKPGDQTVIRIVWDAKARKET